MCESCGKVKRLAGSSKVWVESVATNFLTGIKTEDGYLSRVCNDCRSDVGYKSRKHE